MGQPKIKFKIGDRIINKYTNYIMQIIEVSERYYIGEAEYGGHKQKWMLFFDTANSEFRKLGRK